MASSNDPIGPKEISSPYHGPKPLSTQSKCAIVAFVVGAVAGIVIIGLGAANIFGSIGSVGFIGSLASGGVVTVFFGGGIVWIAIASCKAGQGESKDDASTIKSETDVDTASKTDIVGVTYPSKDKMGRAYPKVGQQAIESARTGLFMNITKFQPTKFSTWGGPDNTYQPVHKEIPLLNTFYWEVCYGAFAGAIQDHPNDPWSQPGVQQLAGDLLKVGYAITCLMLEELPEFVHFLEQQEGRRRSYAEALTRQDSYQCIAFFACARAYHWLRGGIIWNESDGGLDYPQTTPQTHTDLFYQEGTLQFMWRKLYNDHCDRIRGYVKEADLGDADSRFTNWTQKDEKSSLEEGTFEKVPDHLPFGQ
jgi:hypothetical protein